MMIEQFIDRLEQQGLLDSEVIDGLRRKIARSKGKKITPEAIAKYLVDKGHLTRFQATKIVADITGLPDLGSGSFDKPVKKQDDKDDDELTLLPDDDDPTAARETRMLSEDDLDDNRKAAREPVRSMTDEVDELTAIDDLNEEEKKAAEKKAAAKKAAEEKAAEERAAEKKAAEEKAAEKRKAAQQRAAEKKKEARKKAKKDALQKKQPPSKPTEPNVANKREPSESWRMDPEDVVPDSPEPIDMLDADLATNEPLLPDAPHATPLAQRKLQKSSEWDSVLLLVGGASLGVLLIIGGFLYMSLTRGAAEELFAAAEKAYDDESYSLSIKLYDKFLDAYPSHENASIARVKRQTAQLRQVFKDPDRGLKVAQEELPKIKQEEAFPQIRDELASMLPRIAREFVDQALLAKSPNQQEAILKKTAEAMALVNDPEYIPSSLRKAQQKVIESIQEDVARVQREIDRERMLVDTIDAIHGALSSGDTQKAYEVRQTLLNKYPGLDADPSLHEAVLAISEKEREKVQVVGTPVKAIAKDSGKSSHPNIIIAHRMGEAVGGVGDHVVFVLADGSVFALDASTGNVLWRRFVGTETTMAPFPIAKLPGADVIVVDQRTNDVMRLAARTGELVWRLPIGEPFAAPVLLANDLFVSSNSGRLLQIDVQTGESPRHAKIPQQLEAGAGVTPRRPHLYQTGDQDNLYVLANDTLECKEVFYLGHKRGTIAVPPVMALGYLFVAENAGPDFSYLHIIACDQQGMNLKNAQQKIRLRGQVLVPPIVDRRRVLVVTDRRAVELYDVDPNNEDGIPVTLVGRQSATAEAPIISYPLLAGGYMWVANERFAKYQVQASTGKLPREWVLDEQDVYVAPLQLVQDVIVHVRRRKGAAGYTVGATRAGDKEPSWQTEIAVPVRNIAVADKQLEIVTARGRLFDLASDALDQPVVNRATANAMRDERIILALTDAIRVQENTWVLSPQSGYNQVVFHRTSGDRAGLKVLTLTVPRGDAAIEPTPFAGGLLVPLRDGRIVLSDQLTGGERVHPFHPEIEAGTTTQWFPAAVLEGEKEFVIANSWQRVFRVGVKDKPQPHLQELSSLAISEPVVGPLAANGTSCFATTRSTAGDALVSFSLPELKEAQRWPLTGRVLWGPRRVHDMVLLATDSELICMDAAQQEKWKAPWKHGTIAGQPILDDQALTIVAQDGRVLVLDPLQGKTIAEVDVGEPLNWGPVVFQNQLLVAGKSGVVFVLARPRP